MRRDLFALCLVVVLGLSGSIVAADIGEDETAWIGVRLTGAGPDSEGVRISRIFEDSPAARAGLRARDLVTVFNGQPVSGVGELIRQVQEEQPGAWLQLTVERAGRERDLRVRLGSRPDKPGKQKLRTGWIGVDAINLPHGLREHFGAPRESGVMIAAVELGSPADAAGFRLGDVVYDVDGVAVRSRRALHQMISGGGVGNDRVFAVARDGAQLELEARLEPAPEKPEASKR